MTDWIQEYFINPMAFPNKYAPYNLVNTLVFSAAGLLAAYLIYKGLKKYGVKINSSFFYSIIPFIALGSILRVVEDAGALPRAVNFFGTTLYPFITPGIYFITFAATIVSLIVARIASKNEKKFNAITLRLGITLAALTLLPLIPFAFKQSFIERPVIVMLLALASLALFLALRRAQKLAAMGIEKVTVFAQAFDGAATFAGVGLFGYGEQHVVGNFIIDALGGAPAFYLIKTVFAILVVEVLHREKVDGELKTYLLLLITIFGLAPGLRDALRIFLGV